MVRDDIVAEGGDVYMEREAEPGDLGATLAFGLTLTVPVVGNGVSTAPKRAPKRVRFIEQYRAGSAASRTTSSQARNDRRRDRWES